MYKIHTDSIVLLVSAGIYIPFDNENTQYQEYLKWLALGNEPLPMGNNNV